MLKFLSRAAHFIFYGSGRDDADPDIDERGAGNARIRMDQDRHRWILTIRHGVDIEERRVFCDRHAPRQSELNRETETLTDAHNLDHACDVCTEEAR